MLQNPSRSLAKIVCTLTLAFVPVLAHADSFTQTNLVSDIPGKANQTDANLINPWGVSFNATSPFWTANQGSGTSTLFDGAGNINALVVTIPGVAAPPTGPTGTIFNTGTGFSLSNGNSALFVFDTLNGTIVGWNAGAGTTGQVVATTNGAIYTGLAEAGTGGATKLYAANSAPGGTINVFDSSWAATTVPGGFVDASLPAGFVPFNIQAINGNLYVTYAQIGPGGTAMPGGFVDEFDANGNLLHRIASGGPLFAPWGVVIAPAGFGSLANDILIGNFGNGEILAYDPNTFAFVNTVDGPDGLPIINDHLWALETRTGGANNNPNDVYFTAGINDEKDGLFGVLAVTTPEPSTIIGTGSGLIALAFAQIRRRLFRSSL